MVNEVTKWTDDLSSQIDLETQVKVAASILGYKKLPPTIEQFVKDPYYLGNICADLYPFWLEKLKLIYPTPIHTRYPIIVSKGGIGTGKSTFSRILADYQRCRLDHLKNAHRTFKMMPGKYIDFNFFSYSVALAQSEFIDVLNTWDEMSPYFSGGRLSDSEGITLTADGPRGNNAISKDIIYYNLSELNFVNKDKAFEKLNSAFKRWDSRFGRFKNYFGHVIVDTSSRGDDSIADDFCNSNPYGDSVLVIPTNQWIVRAHLNYYGQKGWFKVYAGDAVNLPYIVDSDHPLKDGLDPDRIIDVPEEVRADFEFDLITALQDKAGISTNSSDRLFPNNQKLKESFVLPYNLTDTVKFDFYDKTDKLIYRFDPMLRLIPDDKILYLRTDLGVTGDNTGLAIVYFDKWDIYDKDKKFKRPRFKVPLAVGINRYDGEETSLNHIEEFVFDLNKEWEIGTFSADQFQSRQILQDLTREGIPAKYISVDRSDEQYIMLKNFINNGLIDFCNNKLLKTELSDLRHIGNKVDHTATGCFIIDTPVIVKKKSSKNWEFRTIRELLDTYKSYTILSYNRDKAEFEFRNINRVWKTKTTKLLTTVEFNGNVYKCTPDHKWLTKSGYVEAVRTHAVDFVAYSGYSHNTTYTSFYDYTDVYDIEVDVNHNFCLDNGVVVHNSKDIADAVCGAVYSCYQDLDHASMLSTKYKAEAYSKLIKERLQTPQDRFQTMIQSLY